MLKPLGVTCSGVFLDLGISSPQFDDESRGFRPEQDGPLDLRFDVTRAYPRRVSRAGGPRRAVRILHEYGETADPVAARRIADAVCLAVAEERLLRRPRLSRRSWLPPRVRNTRRCTGEADFPAPIHLNQEFDEMRRGMRAAAEVIDAVDSVF